MIKIFIPIFACFALLNCANEPTDAPPLDAPVEASSGKADTSSQNRASARRCATEEPAPHVRETLTLEVPDMLARETLLVPVVYHVVGSRVTQGQIMAQHRVLAAAYREANISFAPPEIVRVPWRGGAVNAGSPAELAIKQGRRGGAETLNVYIANAAQGLLGWATFPQDAASALAKDGVVIDQGTVPGRGAAPYNLGDTLVHEVGHWLGLLHTFTSGCHESTRGGDLVSDTPAEAEPADGCPLGRNTCASAGLDPIDNYMDYSDDACMVRFTPGQMRRMRAALRKYRKPQI